MSGTYSAPRIAVNMEGTKKTVAKIKTTDTNGGILTEAAVCGIFKRDPHFRQEFIDEMYKLIKKYWV